MRYHLVRNDCRTCELWEPTLSGAGESNGQPNQGYCLYIALLVYCRFGNYPLNRGAPTAEPIRYMRRGTNWIEGASANATIATLWAIAW